MQREQPAHRRFPAFGVAEGAFVLVLAATFACYLAKTQIFVLGGDDLLLAPRGQSLGDYFQPYEENLSVVPIAVYHLVFSWVGFRSYLPLRVIGIGSEAAVAVAIFLVVRSRVGSALAFVAGVEMLWYPGVVLYPSLFNHFFALVATIFCSWALAHDSPAFDVPIALVLAFALCSSGVGVAGAVGCVVYVALSRAPLRRWCAVGVPTAAWFAWWFLVAHGTEVPPGGGHSLSEGAHYVLDGFILSFQGLAADSHALGVILAILFVAYLAWRLRRGPRAARQQLAWSAAMVGWWAGLAFDRGSFLGPDQFRYQVVGSAFAILALLPAQRSEPILRRVTSHAAVGAGLALAGLLVFLNSDGILTHADRDANRFRFYRQTMIVADLGPAVVPDDVRLLLDFVPLSAREYRDLVAKFGPPGGTRPPHPDAELIALGKIGPVVVSPSKANCVALADPTELAATSKFVLRAGSQEVVVQIQRFEDAWVTIGRIPAGAAAKIDLPGLNANTPWMIRAPGACREDH